MKYTYEPFVIRRMAEGRMFFVNPQMPFERSLDCFHTEQPFFLVSQLNDGRIAITPNAAVIPPATFQAWFGTQNLLPTESEYVALRGAYPFVMTAHPVTKSEEWLRKFERGVTGFAKQTFAECASCSHDFIPLKYGKKLAHVPTEEAVEI
jgi:hypothetical protein